LSIGEFAEKRAKPSNRSAAFAAPQQFGGGGHLGLISRGRPAHLRRIRYASAISAAMRIKGKVAVTNANGRCVGWGSLVTRLACAFVVASCGSGGVSDPSTVPVPGPISVTPSTATLYADLPTTFVVSGGNGSYIATSSDQSVLPVVQAFTSNTITVVPNQVAADSAVTLTIRDTGSAAPVNAALTVKPRTLSNVVTITPSSSACGSAVCAGGDAEVSVVLTQGGFPLAGRAVRFDAVSGDFRIITGASGTTEILATSTTTTSDASGTAHVRVRALPDARTQTGLIDITDVSSGLTRHSIVSITPVPGSALSAQPGQLTFVGRDSTVCAQGPAADVIVSGGQPPYSISQSAVFAISPLVLAHSGDRFTVTALGSCANDVRIAVVDALGASATVTAANSLGTAITFPPLVVSPTAVTLTGCRDHAAISIAGGRGAGTYSVTSSNQAVFVQYGGSDFATISRVPSSTPPPSPVTVTVTDGRSVQSVTVDLSLNAAGTCAPGTP
jgi:hypothetical protein